MVRFGMGIAHEYFERELCRDSKLCKRVPDEGGGEIRSWQGKGSIGEELVDRLCEKLI